ncbi:MAG TPA: hypothetical protein VGX23_14640, partial [Actinocrinis sp.]|nr:hypothetical protein [Actinocrinis sp.]
SRRADEPTSRRADEPTSRRADEPTSRRAVLAVGRNGAALTRFSDILSIFDDDLRIRVRFTISPGSPHAAGNLELLAEQGAAYLPWNEAVGLRHGLVISTSANGDLHRLRGPLMLLPHGAGRHKPNNRSRVDEAPYGLAASQLLHRGRVLPDVLGVSHESQFGLLARHCPRALPRAVLVGDPCLDRLKASAHLRPVFREALGVAKHQELVLISSTWGPVSAFGVFPDLPTRALRELPADRYRVALVLHPNIWATYGRRQIEAWYSSAREAGLGLIPWQQGWQAAVLAADHVIGDNGSVTCYAAALGKPVSLIGVDEQNLVPGSPMERLTQIYPAVDDRQDLRDQLGLARDTDSIRIGRQVASEAFGLSGGSAAALRAAAYRLLQLSEPLNRAAPQPVSAPRQALPSPSAYVFDIGESDDGLIELSSFPAALQPRRAARNPGLLAADADAASIRHLSSADIVFRRRPQGLGQDWAGDAQEDLGSLLQAYPGCQLSALITGGTCVMLGRDGVIRRGSLPSGEEADPLVIAVAALVGQQGEATRAMVVRSGGRTVSIMMNQ